MEKTVYLDGNSLTLEDVVAICRHGAKVALTEEAKKAIQISRDIVEKNIAEEKVVYGLNTGFGKFVNVAIPEAELDQLQYNLIVSDACGVGDPFKEDVTRAIMLLRANALAKGFSGIRLSTVETLLEMLNRGVHPVIPEKGSVGSSGDLCPLAHMVMPMIGEGEAVYQGKVMSGKEAMEAAGIPIVRLKAKEGLALINGTCAMMGVASLAVYDAGIIIKTADISASLTVDALEGIVDPYDPRIQEIRPHSGQINVAANFRKLLEGSQLTVHQGRVRVQDAYTLRCLPQIHGASRMAYDYVKQVIETEINSVTDNPLIFPDNGDIFSGGNFHGQPVAVAMDTLGIAIAEYANVAERRVERLVNPQLSGLPGFLTPVEGINDGFMGSPSMPPPPWSPRTRCWPTPPAWTPSPPPPTRRTTCPWAPSPPERPPPSSATCRWSWPSSCCAPPRPPTLRTAPSWARAPRPPMTWSAARSPSWTRTAPSIWT